MWTNHSALRRCAHNCHLVSKALLEGVGIQKWTKLMQIPGCPCLHFIGTDSKQWKLVKYAQCQRVANAKKKNTARKSWVLFWSRGPGKVPHPWWHCSAELTEVTCQVVHPSLSFDVQIGIGSIPRDLQCKLSLPLLTTSFPVCDTASWKKGNEGVLHCQVIYFLVTVWNFCFSWLQVHGHHKRCSSCLHNIPHTIRKTHADLWSLTLLRAYQVVLWTQVSWLSELFGLEHYCPIGCSMMEDRFCICVVLEMCIVQLTI